MPTQKLSRTRLLFGEKGTSAIQHARVIIFGIGGVGSWCAESLVRTGFTQITMVDADRISESNINRQLHATTATVGQVKVDAMRERLLLINPEAQIETIYKYYDAETSLEFDLDAYDYVVDAIDSLSAKAFLISRASQSKAFFVSSMGAALKVDPTRIRVADFWDVQGCPLGSKLRKMIRRNKMTVGHFTCVFDDEVLPNVGQIDEEKTNILQGDNVEWNTKKVATNGSLVHITAIFGFTLAGLITKDLYDRTR